MDIQFVVESYSWKSKAGKVLVYKVSLKSREGHSLTLVGDSGSIFEAFPKGDTVNVKISKTKTLDEILGQGE